MSCDCLFTVLFNLCVRAWCNLSVEWDKFKRKTFHWLSILHQSFWCFPGLQWWTEQALSLNFHNCQQRGQMDIGLITTQVNREAFLSTSAETRQMSRGVSSSGKSLLGGGEPQGGSESSRVSGAVGEVGVSLGCGWRRAWGHPAGPCRPGDVLAFYFRCCGKL